MLLYVAAFDLNLYDRWVGIECLGRHSCNQIPWLAHHPDMPSRPVRFFLKSRAIVGPEFWWVNPAMRSVHFGHIYVAPRVGRNLQHQTSQGSSKGRAATLMTRLPACLGQVEIGAILAPKNPTCSLILLTTSGCQSGRSSNVRWGCLSQLFGHCCHHSGKCVIPLVSSGYRQRPKMVALPGARPRGP